MIVIIHYEVSFTFIKLKIGYFLKNPLLFKKNIHDWNDVNGYLA